MGTPVVDGTPGLPSDCLFDVAGLQRMAPVLAEQFASAKPFPHIVVDGLLSLPKEAMASFPATDWEGWKPVGDVFYQPGKVACDRIEAIPEPFARLIEQLSHPSTLQAIETITGIKGLLPDPYLHGGGLHMSGPGGVLKPHTDFHIVRTLDLHRRLNLLLYLNEQWTESDGGCLEFGEPTSSDRAVIVPTWGRCVLFETDDRSVHGFPVPVREERYRRSIALYYTAAEAPRFSGGTTGDWREHGSQSGLRRLRFGVYRGLQFASRSLAVAAYKANPNVGPGVSERGD
jgi:2OG-Fe(II) oxygenase superfamily